MKYVRLALYFGVGFLAAAVVTLYLNRTPTNAEMLEKVRPSIVTLRNPERPDGGGTGFAVTAPSGKTYILTNAHICEMTEQPFLFAKQAETAAVNGKPRYTRVSPIEVTHETDLCLVSAEGTDLAPLKVAKYANPIREHVYIAGYPRLNPLTVTSGNYSGTDWITVQYCSGITMQNAIGMILPLDPNPIELRPNFDSDEEVTIDLSACLRSLWAISSTAASAPGNSGSPTLNDAGEVVGVLFAGSYRGESFHVPLVEVQKFLSRY